MPSIVDLEEALLGPLVPGRQCGDCVACCEIPAIDTPELVKPADSLCVHCTGRGCGIHATRPTVCRDWFCTWRRMDWMAEASRPDRSGVMISLGFNQTPRNCLEGVYIVARSLAGPELFATPAFEAILRRLGTLTIPVWLSDGTTKTLAHPTGEIARLVISGDEPGPRHRAEVGLWRARYDVFRQTDPVEADRTRRR